MELKVSKGGDVMELKKRIKLAYNVLANKSAITKDDQIRSMLDFLGIDQAETKGAVSEATYYACMKVLSESVGKLPLHLQQYTEKGGVRKAREHPLYNVCNSRPNKYMNATNLWGSCEYNRNHYGDGYILIDGAGINTKLWLLPSKNVEVWYDDRKILGDIPDIYYLYSYGGGILKLGSEEVIHVKGFDSLDGITGMSVKERLKNTVNSGIKSQNLINRMYDSGFTAKAVLQYTGDLSDENARKFTKGIEDYATGKLKNDGIKNIIPIPIGATLQPLNIKLTDNQFVELRQYSALQIASAFGIKPYQIGDYTKSSYSSAEAQQLSFYVETLLYIIKQYEEELTYKLLSEKEVAEGYHFKFNISVILRADFATQVKTLSTAVNSFLLTPNEARSKLDLGSVEGGDRLLGNGASIPVGLTGTQYMQNKNPKKGELHNAKK